MSRYEARCKRLRSALRRSGADALLVTSFTNVTYLTGFTGDDSYLLVGPREEVLVSDPRYTTQLGDECPGLRVHIRPPGESMFDAVTRVARSAAVKRLGVEGDSMSVGLHQRLAAAMPQAELSVTDGLVEQLRLIKDADEISEIRRAVAQAEKAFAVVRAGLHREQSEKQVVDSLEMQLRTFGAKCSSFPPIVATGPRAALPHAQPTEHTIAESPFVLIDWGADSGLYKSDLTRVLLTGRIPAKFEKIYKVVLKAQLRAIEAIKPGASCHEVDAVARTVISQAGFGKYFGHGLGHGIGLDIHEGPRLARGQDLQLKPGMVVTVEPGIYLPGFGGVRIEDDVLVTRSGCEVLTSVEKELADVVAIV
ncbi:MAG: aminopeptidase P family protein [Planctomycetales bacterium]|nr:aminopeptidase P family protein [Planctomycetales bacterium]